MNVKKTELASRAFIPYEISIRIDSEDEHLRLSKEMRELNGIAKGNVLRFQNRMPLTSEFCRLILSHI